MASFTDPPPHAFADRAHRHLLEHPANLRELIEQVDPRLAPGLDMAQSRLLRRDQPLPSWRRSENDLLFEIPFRSADQEPALSTLVNVLVEHQSQPDPAMPLRTLLEATLHWTDQWRAWQGRQPREQPLRLSPVLAIVFHTGEGRWQGFRNLTDLILPPPEFRRYGPVWKPVFWHLRRRPPAALRRGAGEWLRVMAVVRLDRASTAEFERTFAEVARSFGTVGRA